MSEILEKFNAFSEISEEFKLNIKLFYVFDENSVLFVTKEDKVFAFGYNYWGQLGFGHNEEVDTPKEIPELNGKQIKQFFIGRDFVLALNEENQVFGWGKNYYGQLGRGYLSRLLEYLKPEIITELENITEISCGYCHCLTLNKDNNVFSWGNNEYGQVGWGKQRNDYITRPFLLKELQKIKSIHCSRYKSFAVTFNELIYSWGNNREYCLGHKSRNKIYEPKLIIGLNNVISVGFSYKSRDNGLTYFLTNEGIIYFCGTIDSRDYEFQKIPKILETGLKFQSIQTIICDYSYNEYYYELLALSKEAVYYLRKNVISRTKYKTFLDYCLNEKQITFKTNEIKFSDRFDSLEKMGQGGFGIVWQVKDIKEQKLYALKIIELEKVKEKNELLKEVKLLSEYKSEYLIKYYNHWIEQDKFYIQMELCSNNLKNIIEEKRKCFERQSTEEMTKTEYFISSHLMKEIVECVQYLHQIKPNPIIHRDLKPANILVNYEPINGRYLKLCDFGLATFGAEVTITHTRWAGTQNYMAPEVSKGLTDRMNKARYSTKADIYSLGQIACDLFDFDINSSDKRTEKSDLTQNWSELKKKAIKMQNAVYRERPTCTDLLSSFNEWAVIEISEEFRNSESFKRNINKLKEFENKFFINYFNSKNQILKSFSN